MQFLAETTAFLPSIGRVAKAVLDGYFRSVSASELIEQIKALPPAELEVVRNFLLNGERNSSTASGVKYLDREEARALGDKVMEKHDELFRRLAE